MPPKNKGKPKDTSSSTSNTSSSGALKPANSISVRHILCNKHSAALSAIARLDAGESFDTVAREVSEDKARQGGNLGWKTRGSLIKEFEDMAYTLPVSSVGKPIFNREPVKTSEGYHVIMIEGRK